MMLSKLQKKIIEDGRKQNVIAKAAGLPPARISDYIHGRRTIPVPALIALAEVLKCNPSDLLGQVEPWEESLRVG